MTKTKAIRMPGKEHPAASQTRIQWPPRRSLTLGMLARTRNPPPSGLVSQTVEGLDADSFGASPVFSALDHSARRDPGGATTTVTRNHSS